MTHAGPNGDLPRNDDDSGEHDRPREDVSALRAQLATTHARYHRAVQDAQRAPDTASRRTALAEARRLAAHASRLQSRINKARTLL
jgi:hypothetical protein